MIVIKRKSIRSLERKSHLCLIIPLGGGAKAQYPFSNEAEAIALYKEYLRLNPDLEEAELIHG